LLVRAATLLGDVMSLIPPVASSRCKCGRATTHIHYSSNHDFFVKLGLICFLFAEGVSFIAGWVKGSTLLVFSTGDIAAYDRVNSTIAQLTGPYQGLNNAAMATELLIIGFAFVALSTLRSQHWREIHLMSVVAVIGLFFLRWAMETFYGYLTNAAIARLPEFVDATTLAIAARIDGAFQASYGFWGSAGPDAVITILSFAGLALFICAIWKRDVVATWTPGTVTTVIEPPAPTTPPQPPTSPTVGATTIPPTKFCRFCGAKIPRESKFCEECGKRLG